MNEIVANFLKIMCGCGAGIAALALANRAYWLYRLLKTPKYGKRHQQMHVW